MTAQAAHIPVHLGAMAESVGAVRALDPTPGEVFILNDPYTGGSHLPDITLIGAIDITGQVGGDNGGRGHPPGVGGNQAGRLPPRGPQVFSAGGVVAPPPLPPAGGGGLLPAPRAAPTPRG